MGTLTGETPALDEHCPHKLPTSCRLTATPTCCACQDKRPHGISYPTYVDGVGLVNRGTRWLRYCWFCQQFWNNRVAATTPPVDPKNTRIPDEPDQTEFLGRWFDYHRGFKRVLNDADGTERYETLTRERNWLDTSPGHLPVENITERILPVRIHRRQVQETDHVSLDATLDELLASAEDQDAQNAGENSNVAPGRTPPNARPAAAAHAANATVTSQSSADRHAVVSSRDPRELAARVRDAHQEVQAIQSQRRQKEREVSQLRQAARQADECRGIAERELNEIQNEVRTRRHQLGLLQREQRSQLHLERVFGTREEIQQQGSEYVSPLTSMFSRAYDRYRVAEEVRAEQRHVERHETAYQEILRQTEHYSNSRYPQNPMSSMGSAPPPQVTELDSQEIRPRTLDDDEDRPPPCTDEQMTIKLDCKICLQQRADTAVLPCGHLIMCFACSNIAVPTRSGDQTQPARRSQCPLCKKAVKRVARIYTS